MAKIDINGIYEFVTHGVLDIITGRSAATCETFTVMTDDGMTDLAVMVVDKELAQRIQDFVQNDIQDEGDLRFEKK